MTSINSSPAEEVCVLADSLFDGKISGAQMRYLETLITNNSECLQLYLERMAFHSEMVKNAEARSPAQAAVAVMSEFSRSIRLRDRRHWRSQFAIYASMVAALLLVAVGTVFLTGGFQPAPVAVMAGLSEDFVPRSKPVELGRLIRQGEALEIEKGIATFEFPNVILDVVGPASVCLESPTKVILKSGSLFARMLNGSESLSVTTPDVEVIDLGTEFHVHHDSATGTDVSVRQGRVRAKLLDWRGNPTSVLELTDGRSARFRSVDQTAKEIVYQEEAYQKIDRSRGGIQRIDGTLRTTARTPVALYSGQWQTPNHILVIPEQQNVLLTEELIVPGVKGQVRIPKGTTVSSYLVHYDPTILVNNAPRGSVTFFEEIVAATGTLEGLESTDAVLGLPGVRYEEQLSRGFEPEEDIVRISLDRHTVSFYFGVEPGAYLDEVRIIVANGTPRSINQP